LQGNAGIVQRLLMLASGLRLVCAGFREVRHAFFQQGFAGWLGWQWG